MDFLDSSLFDFLTPQLVAQAPLPFRLMSFQFSFYFGFGVYLITNIVLLCC